MQLTQSLRWSLQRWLNRSPDEDVLRWLYRGLIVATIAVIALDYMDMQNGVVERTTDLPSPAIELPSALPLPGRRDGGRRTVPLRVPEAKLREKMTFDLVADGRLVAIGTIMAGTAEQFAAEVTKRGAYIKTVVLQSPGGSVRDALAMGRLIRDRKLSTAVESGGYCASACPLVFAGGVERRVGAKAAVGVHQVSAVGGDSTLSGAAGMENAQQISAECQRYLRDMGVDLEVWIHAMATPSDEIYIFKPDELLALKLATVDDAKVASAANH